MDAVIHDIVMRIVASARTSRHSRTRSDDAGPSVRKSTWRSGKLGEIVGALVPGVGAEEEDVWSGQGLAM
eukprot:416324-Prymnesium_polylepis.2